MIVGITGCTLRASASGNVIDMVRTDPRLVPTHNVGNNLDGSKKKKEKNDDYFVFSSVAQQKCTRQCHF